jgi:uncharacterized SAM-binding protein YcdF (DUF218 family)
LRLADDVAGYHDVAGYAVPVAEAGVRRLRARRSRPARLSWLRRCRLLITALLALTLAWLAACYLVVAQPTVNKPVRSDAILVLGPPLVDGRLDEALRLASAHYAGTVLISIGWDKGRQRIPACTADNPAYQVICFRPDPATTRGEAEQLGLLAQQRGWRSVLVVTSKYHVSRARLIVGRCMPGTVRMLAAPGKPSVGDWLYQFGYQTGGFAKAFLHRSC